MSMFENDKYRWRETYFVLFDSKKRPSLKEVRKALSRMDGSLLMTNLNATDEGAFESLTLLATDDFAALDICYLDGDEVREHTEQLIDELSGPGCEPDSKEQIEQIRLCNARFDVLHFEQIADFIEDEPEGMLDPSTLLLVLNTLAKLCGGTAIDPQGGIVVSGD